jgi:outer membrane protein assembly factor BamB
MRLAPGRLRWSYHTGEVIDSPTVLGGGGTVTFGSGDEHVYRLRMKPRRARRAKRAVWRFRASLEPAQARRLTVSSVMPSSSAHP